MMLWVTFYYFLRRVVEKKYRERQRRRLAERRARKWDMLPLLHRSSVHSVLPLPWGYFECGADDVYAVIMRIPQRKMKSEIKSEVPSTRRIPRTLLETRNPAVTDASVMADWPGDRLSGSQPTDLKFDRWPEIRLWCWYITLIMCCAVRHWSSRQTGRTFLYEKRRAWKERERETHRDMTWAGATPEAR